MAGEYTASRSLFFAKGDYESFRRDNGVIVTNTTTNQYLIGKQVTTSYRTRGRGTSILNRLQAEHLLDVNERDYFDFAYYKNQGYDTGHPFATYKQEFSCTHPKVYLRGRPGTQVWYKGPLVPQATLLTGGGVFADPVLSTLVAEGTSAIQRTSPLSPIVNSLQTLAELRREGISFPGVNYAQWLKSRTGLLNAAGGEYLNLAFGWIPLISELNKVLTQVVQVNKIVQQVVRDSGRDVRRQYTFKDDVTTSYRSKPIVVRSTNGLGTSDQPKVFALDSGGNVLNLGELSESVHITKRTWFAGAYTYFLDTDDNLSAKLKRYALYANRLLGVRLTPAVLWELTPWSWLADYFANFGDIAANISAFGTDGLVLRYGYIMQEVTHRIDYTVNGHQFYSGGPRSFSSTLLTTSKVRRKATPYGFGLNPATFSLRQWSILAALGMSKAPAVLR